MKKSILYFFVCVCIVLSSFGTSVIPVFAEEQATEYIMYEENMENGDLSEALGNIKVSDGKQDKLSLVQDPLNPNNRVLKINGGGESLTLISKLNPNATGSDLSISYKFMSLDTGTWDPMLIGSSDILWPGYIHYTLNSFVYRTHINDGSEKGEGKINYLPAAQRINIQTDRWYRIEMQFLNIADENPDNRRYNFYVYEINSDGTEILRVNILDQSLFCRNSTSVQTLNIHTPAGIMYIDDMHFTTNRIEDVGMDKYKMANDYEWLTQDILTQESFDELTQSLNLPTVGPFNSKIAWSCSDPSVVAVDTGAVYRQSLDKEITLTATFTKGAAYPRTKSFTFNVKMAEVSDQEAVDAAAEYLSIPNSSTIISDFPLPLTGIYNTSVQWSVDTNDYLKVLDSSAVINRSDENVTIPLRAVITRGSASATTEVPVTIMEKGFEESLCSIFEDFDEQELSTMWRINDSLEGITQATEDDEAVLKLNKTTGDGVISATANFSSIFGQNVLETRFKTDITGQQILLVGGTFGTSVAFQEDGGRLKAKIGSQLYDLCEFHANEWYTAQIAFDTLKGTISIRINGAESLPEVVARDYAYDIMSFAMKMPNGATGTLCVDYVKIMENIASEIAETVSLLKLDYIDSDNITESFTVPVTGTNGTTISWRSNNPAISFVGEQAIVTRPEASQEHARIQLTATINKEFMNEEVSFFARVLKKTTAQEDAQADLDAITIPEIVDSVATPDLELVKTGTNGSTITYKSSNQDVITNSGKVLSIGYDENQSVTLTARAEKAGSFAEKEFTVSVQKVNLMYDKFPTSSTSTVGFSSIYAIDENAETAWLSDEEETKPSITVDLYQPVKINQIRLMGKGAGVKNAKLEYSLNNISYQPLLTLTNVGEEMKLFSVDTVEARYLRYTITEKTLESAGLSELQAYYKESVSNIFDDAVAALTITNRKNIKGDFTLPSAPEGYSVTWTSDTPDVIYIEGNSAIVTRKKNDTTVTLTATLECDGLTYIKEFNDCRVIGTSGGNSTVGGGSNVTGGNRGTQGSVSYPSKTTPEYIPNKTSRFVDVPSSHWAYSYIERLAENNIMNGRSSDSFVPDDSITREEFVKLIITGFGFSISSEQTGFSDVDETAWYAQYLSSAKNLGIVSGISEKEFGVGQQITREDMAVMIVRAAEKKGIVLSSGAKTDFADADTISDYAADSVTRLSEAGILSGSGDNMFVPKGIATRAQAAKIIAVLLFN